MDGIDIWIYTIIVGIIGSIVGTVIYEFFKAPIRRYLRRRTKAREAKERESIAGIDPGIIPIEGGSAGAIELEESGTEDLTERLSPSEAGSPEDKVEGVPSSKEIREIIEVDPGWYETKTLRLKKGNRVSGLAKELSGQDFNLYVLDRKAYADFINRDSFESVFWCEGKVAIPFDFRISRTGKYYFVFDAYRKQYPRDVEFECAVHQEE